MVGIQGLGGIPDPSSERPANVRDRKRDDVPSASSSKDGIRFSPVAQEMASAARLVQEATANADMRLDKVAAAKQSIENGDYKRRDVVEKVAEKISKYLP